MFLVRLLLILLLRTFLLKAIDSCNYEMPKEECEQKIPWKAKSIEEAQAICANHFPTMFITATKTETEITCTVKSGYMCTDPGAFVFYDKCIKFDTTEQKIGQATDCEELAAPYSYKHFSFIGMAAARKGINKLWVGMTSDGKAYKRNKMLIKNLWTTEQSSDPASKFIIFRTRNDYIRHKSAGSFEYVDGNEKATHACVKNALFNSEQKWYCDKMKLLGLSTVYDKQKSKCLYTTTSRYTFNKPEDVKSIKGCKENPFPDIHSSGMDDGIATDSYSYNMLDPERVLRISGLAADFVKNVKIHDSGYIDHVKKKGSGYSGEYEFHRMKWRAYGHFVEEKYLFSSNIPWFNNSYPMNEDSSFPGDATTIGVKQGKKIDVPSQARLRAVCSIQMFSQCQIFAENKKPPCKRMQECKNSVTYNKNNNKGMLMDGFFTCKCPEQHREENDGTCTWIHGSETCAYFYYHDRSGRKPPAVIGAVYDRSDKPPTKGYEKFENLWSPIADYVYQIVVRDRCHATMKAHPIHLVGADNPRTLNNAGYGTHDVPNHQSKTVDYEGLSASSYSRHCDF